MVSTDQGSYTQSENLIIPEVLLMIVTGTEEGRIRAPIQCSIRQWLLRDSGVWLQLSPGHTASRNAHDIHNHCMNHKLSMIV